MAVAAVMAVAMWAPPGVALADAAGPSDWRSQVVSVEPTTDAVTVSIAGGDAFLRIEVEPGHEVVVLGYEGEPYLRIDEAGEVFENRNSFATYYNTERDGGEIPSDLDTTLPPEWSRVGDGGDWAWHDHRAHYMGDRPPSGIGPGDALPGQVVPIVVDGVDTSVTVVTTRVGQPSWLPTIGGVLTALAIAAAAFVRARFGRPLASLVVGAVAMVAGLAQFASLPGSTDPRLTWWVMPAIAVVAALVAVALATRRAESSLIGHGLLLIADVQLLLWAWERRSGLRRGVLPTDLDAGLDRWITATALVFGAVSVAIAVFEIARTAIQPPVATATANPD